MIALVMLLALVAIAGSGWWALTHENLWWLPIPLAAVALVAVVIWWRREARRARVAPAVPDWHVWDEELPPDLSPTEHEMLRAFASSGSCGIWPVNQRNGELK